MLSLRLAFLCFGIIAVNLSNVYTLAVQELNKLQEMFTPTVDECSKEYGVNIENFEEAKKIFDSSDVNKCLLACMLKKTGLINDKGLFDKDITTETVKKYLHNEVDIKTANDVINDCGKVNDKEVKDGESGCERAKLLLQCFIDSKDKAISDAEKSKIQAKFLSSGIECFKDYSLTADDIKAFKAKMIPDRRNAKCFAACLFKKIGIMDDMGKITKAGALESAKEVFKDEDHLKRIDEFFEKCASVNKQNVSDGKKGCDRAKLAFTCMAEHADEYGFNIDF